MENRDRVIIVGAGITGLTIGFWLKKKGIPFVLLEESPAPGGKIRSLSKRGFDLDLGPVTCAKNQALGRLIKEAGLESAVLLPSRAIRRRYIFSNGKLHAIEPHPLKLLTNKIISFKSKLNWLKEVRLKPLARPEDESVSSFVQRHFGDEILQKIFDPVLSGIYAGNPDQLSVHSVLPMLKRLEGEYGSVMVGLWKNRKSLNLKREIISLAGGFQSLTDALANEIGPSLHLNAKVLAVDRSADTLEVVVADHGGSKKMRASRVILSLPALDAARLLVQFDEALAETLNSIKYNPVWQIYCVVKSEDFAGFDGFGFLIPSSEKMTLVGCIHNSGLFPGKTLPGFELFTLFCKTDPVASIARVLADFTSILKIRNSPEVINIQKWSQAIPQPEVGHPQKIAAIKEFELKYTGIRFGGNYVSGVSVGDCVKYGESLAADLEIPK